MYLIIFIAQAGHVFATFSLKRPPLRLPSNTNFHVYVVEIEREREGEKKKRLCVKVYLEEVQLKEAGAELSGGAHRNSSSVRQNKAVIISLTCKP